MSVKIAASILSADFSRLGAQVQEAIDAGADYIHVDVMDGVFVPNLTIGPAVMASIQPLAARAGIPLDVHLMTVEPERLVPMFVQAGAGIVTVHVEACRHLHRTVQMIRELGARPGVTLNPATSLASLEEILPYVEQVLVMTVNPGFGGQAFLESSYDKVARLEGMLAARGLAHVDIEVDGGIAPANAARIVQAGARVLVSGSAIYNRHASVRDNIAAFRSVLPGRAG